MSKLSFVKYHGAGNDFILIDDRTLFFDPTLVPQLCHRHFGIGADGLILLQHDSLADFRMRIYNSDGSEAESCGNGLRCLFLFLLHLGLPQQTYQIATGENIVEASMAGDKVSIELMPVSVEKERIGHGQQYTTGLNVKQQYTTGLNVKRLYICERPIYFLDTGVPHVVTFDPEVNKLNMIEAVAPIRHHPEFQPKGTNVNFAEVQKDHVRVRTFERGLEGEPLACGTGSAAVAVVMSQIFGWPDPIRIVCAGGDLEFYVKDGLRMVGPAAKVFEGIWQRR